MSILNFNVRLNGLKITLNWTSVTHFIWFIYINIYVCMYTGQRTCHSRTSTNIQAQTVCMQEQQTAEANDLLTTLPHLQQKDSYARLLFIDFSLVFNMISPHRLLTKFNNYSLLHSTCLWIKDFQRPLTESWSGTWPFPSSSPRGYVLPSPTVHIGDCIERVWLWIPGRSPEWWPNLEDQPLQ